MGVSVATLSLVWLLMVWIVYQLLQIRQPGETVKVSFAYPFANRVNFKVSYKPLEAARPRFGVFAWLRGQARPHTAAPRPSGPWGEPAATRVKIVRGADLLLTRDSVDGEPDAEDRASLTAPMEEVPIGVDGLFRSVGLIGIESGRPEICGRLHIEVVDARGAVLAERICDF